MTTLSGKVSWFGGPNDEGVAPDEGLAFIYGVEDRPELFLEHQPAGTTGLARRLNPEQLYIACRWNYDETPKTMLREMRVMVWAPLTGREFAAIPADWGPNEETGRVADLSPGLMEALGIQTDDEVTVTYEGVTPMPFESIVISSGHGLHVRGAHGILDEVDEARRVVEELADMLRDRGVSVVTFHDDVSTMQNENLNRIVDFHNKHTRDLDISVHFNAYEQTSKPMGTEVLYITQGALAGKLATAIAESGFINRGAKKRTDLFFLNQTEAPAVLLEICFVDSEADADLYCSTFNDICMSLADELGGVVEVFGDEAAPPQPVTPPPPARVDIEVSGPVVITVNGVVVASN
jgi:N-acetylmuramoyl-L-alanine amidase